MGILCNDLLVELGSSTSVVPGWLREYFDSGGREDIDVRMLGKGRPFALELINPRVSLSIN